MGRGCDMGYQKVASFLGASAMLASLVACGFTPVYGPDAKAGQTLSDIQVEPPNSREEYLFVRNIEERLGRNLSANNVLKHTISVSETGVDIFGAARSRVMGVVRYQLVSRDTGQVIVTGSVESFTGYSLDDNVFKAGKRDAAERLMKILADKTVTDLMLKLSNR